MKKQHIVHCDLKPENVLFKDSIKKDIKIIDFGSGCFDNENGFSYVQSRYYRAPEVVIGMSYD
jgi:dual specificity tyrosine-phosphorylation-regulated kinase 2/3/4